MITQILLQQTIIMFALMLLGLLLSPWHDHRTGQP